MNINFKKVALWSGVAIVTGITVWQISKAVKRMKEQRLLDEQAKLDAQNTGGGSNSGVGSTPKPVPVKFDYSKVLRPGQAPSPELTAAKMIFNKVIESAKRMSPISSSQYDPQGVTNQKEARRKAVAALEILDTATKYGSGTEKVAQTLLGTTSFTFTRVKQFHIDWNMTYNLPAPYKN